MVGAALTWDWLYNDLDPAFREQFRQILWQHARAMYYGGHKGGNPEGGYWRGMPNYNHRWFRDWGMTLAALGAAEGKPEEQWFLGEVEKELQFNATWLPVDGSQHEGPGYGSSAGALGMAFQVSDELTGTHYLDTPFYKTAAAYTLEISAPGMKEAFYFADCFDKARSFHPFFLKTAADASSRPMSWTASAMLSQRNAKAWGTRIRLGCRCSSTIPASRAATTQTAHHGFPARRRCRRRARLLAGQCCRRQVQVRPDGRLPDQCLATRRPRTPRAACPTPTSPMTTPTPTPSSSSADGDYLAETDRYPLKPGKLSSGHNTILINGLGQAVLGRPEGDEWQQPGSGDMSDMARITAFKDAGDVVVVEGEAAGAYLAYNDAKSGKSRPAIDRFRRTFIWVKGSYILVFDDVRSPKPVEITWLMQGAKLEPVKEDEGRYRLAKGQAQCEFQLVADLPLKSKIGVSTANDHEN